MERSTRKSLLWVAGAVFVLAAPTLLLYAQGYRFIRPFPRTSSRTTPSVGALVVRTVPRGASVSVNGRVVDRRTPTGVGGFPTGTYAIRIEKRGYRPYEKRLEIVGGRVADLLTVRLLPQSVVEETVRSGTRGIWVSPNGKSALLLEGTRLLSGEASDLIAGTSRAAGLPGRAPRSIQLPVPSAADLRTYWAPGGSFLIVASSSDTPPASMHLIDTRTGRSRRLPHRGAAVGWTRRGPERFLLLTPENALIAFDPAASGTDASRVFARDVTLAAVHPEGVVIQQNGPTGPFMSLLKSDGGHVPIGMPSPNTLNAAIVSPFGSIAAVDANGTLVVLPRESGSWRILAKDTRSFQWSPDGDKLLYRSSDFDLWVVNIAEERSVLPLFAPELLVRLSTRIRDPQWFPDSQRVLFIEQDILRWVELDPRDGHHVEHLTSSNRGDSILAVRPDGDLVWLTARRNGADVLLALSLRTPDDL